MFAAPADPMFATPTAPVSRWKPWHKTVLGVVGVLTLCLCGVIAFGPDPDSGKSPEPADSPAVAALQQAATTTPKAQTSTPPKTATTTKPKATTTKPKATATKATVYYADCDDAPGELSTGDPGYRKALDRDGDGVACESGGDDDEPVEVEEPAEDTDPRFPTCKAANAGGYGDYVRGVHPEYDWYQDRDGDGVVCET
jgi:hypothetical protein